jgi:branched-chain amino acid transport system permease protein
MLRPLALVTGPNRSAVGRGVALALAGYLVLALALPHGLPLGILVFGLLFGLLNALGAIAVILIYRAGRYINFAQGGLGAAGATLAFRLTTVYHWNWFLAVITGLLVSIALAGLVEVIFIQRLFNSPKLVLTVATIGIAQFLAFFELAFAKINKGNLYQTPRLQPPLHWRFHIGQQSFGPAQILVLIVVPLVLGWLLIFLHRSRYGSVVQAAAENPDRARLLGVSVRSLSTVAWLMVGALSGLAGILETPVVGISVGGTTSGPAFLLRALAPAMVAGLSSLPTAVFAALGLGIVEEALAFNLNRSGPIEVVLLVVILVALLVRRTAGGRAAETDERSFAVATAVRAIPRELARELPVRLASIGGRGVLVGGAIAAPLLLDISGQNLATALLAFLIAALSVVVLTGYAGQVSFGDWAVVGFGALFGGAMATQHHVPFLAGLLVIPIAGAFVAALIGLPALRIRGIFLGVTTLAFAVAGQAYFFQQKWFELTDFLDRPTLLGVNLADQRAYYYFCLLLALLCMVGVQLVRKSMFGRAMVAVRDNESAASSYGVNPVLAKLSAFAVSGFLAALSGFLYAYNAGKIDGGSFPALTSLLLFSAVVIGGLGSQAGAVIGALYFRGISYFLPQYVQFLATSLGLLLILLFLPKGLGGLFFSLRDAALRRYAIARGIRVPSLLADTREDEEARDATFPVALDRSADLAVPAGVGGRQ